MRSQEAAQDTLESHLHELENSAVQEDITTFLTERLSHTQVDPEIISKLAKRSGVLFIYATTVVRYILDPTADLDNAGTRDMDDLYSTILDEGMSPQQIDQRERNLMRRVLHSVVLAQEPISSHTIASFLGIDDPGLVQDATA
ncbi:Vegetative incompatibility protein HET-E-1 [Ceratobasidium sp. AG-Ba]|nr:Vegetative incompatibility protein HET-E-1 [Ceratobasidium sp. AG-Ba]